MRFIKCALLLGIIIFSSQAYCQGNRNVVIFEEDSSILELGRTEKINLIVKNINDTDATIDLYIGSTDDAFRNWLWFENHRYDTSRVQQKIKLAAHEQRHIIVNVFAGKVGNYDLIVGPDGSDITNMYDSTEIRIVHKPGSGIFSITPGLGFGGLFLIIIIASIVILTRGTHK